MSATITVTGNLTDDPNTIENLIAGTNAERWANIKARLRDF